MKKGEKMEKEKNVPTGVKVISVLYYIGAVFGIIVGLLLLVVAGGVLSSVFGDLFNLWLSVLAVVVSPLAIQISSLLFFGLILLALEVPGLQEGGLVIFSGLMLLTQGIFGIFIGRGLWRARHWARIVAIIFACLGVLITILSMVLGIIVSNLFGLGNLFSLVINAIIGAYLLFNSSVKQAFA